MVSRRQVFLADQVAVSGMSIAPEQERADGAGAPVPHIELADAQSKIQVQVAVPASPQRRSTFSDLKSLSRRGSDGSEVGDLHRPPRPLNRGATFDVSRRTRRGSDPNVYTGMRRSIGDSLSSFAAAFKLPFSQPSSRGTTPRNRIYARLEAELKGYQRQGLKDGILELRPLSPADDEYELNAWRARVRLHPGGAETVLMVLPPENYPFAGPVIRIENQAIKFVTGLNQVTGHDQGEAASEVQHVSWTPAQNLQDAVVASIELLSKRPTEKKGEGQGAAAASEGAAATAQSKE